ncbi:MAG: MTH1187 family thiamine-binding protein [Desulfatiglandaceae bacterium]
MALMEFTLIPLDKGASFSKYVSGTLSVVKESGLDYRLNPMGTVVEGEWDDLLALLTSCVRQLEKESDRISLSVKFDIRKGLTGALDGKIKSVQEKSGFTVKT